MTLCYLACLWAGHDTSQILSDVFFSYNKGFFTLYSVYFSVLLKNLSKKKSNKQLLGTNTTIYRVSSAIFFFLASRFSDVSINAIWLARACAVSYAWKAIWLADACIASRKVEHFSTVAASYAWNATQQTQRNQNSVRQMMTSPHWKWMGMRQPCRINAFQRVHVSDGLMATKCWLYDWTLDRGISFIQGDWKEWESDFPGDWSDDAIQQQC